MRGALIDEVFSKGGNDPVKKDHKGCPYIRARVNGIWTKILIDTGAEISAISQSFINRHQKFFKKASMLPVMNTQIQTATSVREKVTKQVLVNIQRDKFDMDVTVMCIKNLMYDVIFGIDVLFNMQARLDIIKCELLTKIKGEIFSFKLNERGENNGFANNIQAPVISRQWDRIVKPIMKLLNQV
jgi:hypothetical protein